MPLPGHSSSSASPTPSITSLRPARIPSAAGAHGSSASPSGPSNVALFVTNLRLLDLDLRHDWPSIDAQTFSTQNAQQNQKQRIRCVEWSLFRLFELWDAEETKNKLQPFFPPLEPLQSLNLRAALFRCLSELKKNGILGRETILRKTMLDECKGEKLEEVLLVFSTAVLKKVVAGKRRRGGDATITRKLATTNSVSAHEFGSMLPLAIAHKASLTALLRRKRALRRRYEEFGALLDSKQRHAIQENEQLMKMVDQRSQDASTKKEEAHSLRRHFLENWLGDSDWVDTIFDGDRRQEDLLLTTPFKEVCSRVIEGRLSNLVINKQKGLLEDLEHRLKEHQERLATWKGFQDELLKRRPSHATSQSSDVVREPKIEPEITFSAHKDLMPPPRVSPKLPQLDTTRGYMPVPEVSQEYERLITAMNTELANVGKSKTRNGARLRKKNKLDEGEKGVEEPQQSPLAVLDSKNNATDDGQGEPTGDDEEHNTPNPRSGMKEAMRSPTPSKQPHQNNAPNGHLSFAGTKADDESQVAEERATASSESESDGTKPLVYKLAISPTHTIPPPKTSAATASTPNTGDEDQDQLAEDIIARVTQPQPSPLKKRPTLSERTRMSMAFSSAEDIHQHPLPIETPLQPSNHPTNPSNTKNPTETPSNNPLATLQERTRHSMSLLPTLPPHRNPKPHRKSIYPTNQFETPQKQKQKQQQRFPGNGADVVDEEEEEETTLKEDLFSQEADYASIFKSRPKIALSPTFSPALLDGGLDEVGGNGNGARGDGYGWGSSPLARAKAGR